MAHKSVKGTETEKNLMRAFSGESQARTRYLFFAKQARKDGYEYIADIFELTAANETEHAKMYFKQLEGGMVEFSGTYPAGVIGTTLDNLREAAQGEHDEWQILYPSFAKVAEQEGFRHIARLFRLIAEVEHMHNLRYLELLKEVETNTVFSSTEEEVWECLKCGYEHHGKDAPAICPICGHPQAFFTVTTTDCRE